jgi:hypothetical protein
VRSRKTEYGKCDRVAILGSGTREPVTGHSRSVERADTPVHQVSLRDIRAHTKVRWIGQFPNRHRYGRRHKTVSERPDDLR